MNEKLKLPQSTFSQHLSKLKNLKIIKGKRNGLEIHYYLTNSYIRKIANSFFNANIDL